MLEPIVIVVPPPGEERGEDETEPGTRTGGGGGDEGGGGSDSDDTCNDTYAQPVVDDPDCNSPENPTEEEAADARSCPKLIVGKVITALIEVAGRNHEFRFEATIKSPLVRLSAARSPATYQIAEPTASEDVWWIAESGTIEVNCNGAYSPSVFGARIWIGTTSYANDSDLHMVMGPGHPLF